jgi:transposase
MKQKPQLLSEEQWKILEPLFPEPEPSSSRTLGGNK